MVGSSTSCQPSPRADAFVAVESRLGVRAGHAGATRLDAAGWRLAVFEHETQRDGWLHTHVHYVLPNCVLGVDGVWRTVDSRRLVPEQKVIGAVLHASLRREMGERLGVEYDHVLAANGIIPAIGVPEEYREARSSRRRAIEVYLARHHETLAARGIVGRRAELFAEAATRNSKDTTLSLYEVRHVERERLDGLGVEIVGAVEALVGAGIVPAPGLAVEHPWPMAPGMLDRAGRAVLFDRLAGPNGLTAHQACFTRADVLVACLTAAGSGSEAEGRVLAAEFLAERCVLAAGGDGGSGRWWTTPDMLAAQTRLRDAWDLLDPARLVDPAVADAAVTALQANGNTVSSEQSAAVRRVGSGRGGLVVEGPPGCGKTSVVAAGVVAAARARGWEVFGTAVALEAANGLANVCGLDPTEFGTIAGLLARADRVGLDLFDKTLIVVDEASMLGARQAAALVEQVQQGGGRILLIGDRAQAPPVEAGGVFADLATRPGTTRAELVVSVRQTDPAERARVRLLKAGHPDEALTSWAGEGRVHLHPDTESAVAAAATEIAEGLVAGRVVAGMAATRAEAAELSAAVRSRLLGATLPNEEVFYGGLRLSVGDRVVLGRNDPTLAARNGARGTVTATTVDGISVELRDGVVLVLPARYVAAHVRWGYATTVHQAQGLTVDESVVLASPAMYQELAVVAGSRHRHTITWHAARNPDIEFTDTPPDLAKVAGWMSASRLDPFAEADHEPPALEIVQDARDRLDSILALAASMSETDGGGDLDADLAERIDTAALAWATALEEAIANGDCPTPGDLDHLAHLAGHPTLRPSGDISKFPASTVEELAWIEAGIWNQAPLTTVRQRLHQLDRIIPPDPGRAEPRWRGLPGDEHRQAGVQAAQDARDRFVASPAGEALAAEQTMLSARLAALRAGVTAPAISEPQPPTGVERPQREASTRINLAREQWEQAAAAHQHASDVFRRASERHDQAGAAVEAARQPSRVLRRVDDQAVTVAVSARTAAGRALDQARRDLHLATAAEADTRDRLDRAERGIPVLSVAQANRITKAIAQGSANLDPSRQAGHRSDAEHSARVGLNAGAVLGSANMVDDQTTSREPEGVHYGWDVGRVPAGLEARLRAAINDASIANVSRDGADREAGPPDPPRPGRGADRDFGIDIGP